MFLLDLNKVAGDIPGAAKQLQAVLERNNAEILASRVWSDTKLAYPVEGHKKGLYYLMVFRTEGQNITVIQHDFSLNEMVLRMLVLRIDPKMVDQMLDMARNENATALRTVQDTGDDDLGTESEPPRRGRRDRDREPVKD
jgi:small subunit ribosomal protein S6